MSLFKYKFDFETLVGLLLNKEGKDLTLLERYKCVYYIIIYKMATKTIDLQNGEALKYDWARKYLYTWSYVTCKKLCTYMYLYIFIFPSAHQVMKWMLIIFLPFIAYIMLNRKCFINFLISLFPVQSVCV